MLFFALQKSHRRRYGYRVYSSCSYKIKENTDELAGLDVKYNAMTNNIESLLKKHCGKWKLLKYTMFYGFFAYYNLG